MWSIRPILLSTVLCLLGLHLSLSECRAQQMTDDANHSEWILAVDEYCPAPGQFVGLLPPYTDGDTPEAMAQKCTRAIGGPIGATAEDDMVSMISLGSWGGYVTFHFDHSIANIEGQRDFYIAGNAFEGSSEPGIVMVMKDENRNGLPDDTWYELSGSADVDSVGKVRYQYEVTYIANTMDDIPWTDNQGQTGVVPRNPFHEDNEYFPLWVASPLTLSGTRLPDNVYLASKRPKTYAMRALRYGYADNLANTDTEGCSFDIGWAVDNQRQPVRLDFIDFVRVYTGTLQVVSAAVGESSTELQGARDLHLSESIAAIGHATGIMKNGNDKSLKINTWHDLTGRTMNGKRKGISIVRLNNGQIRKILIK